MWRGVLGAAVTAELSSGRSGQARPGRDLRATRPTRWSAARPTVTGSHNQTRAPGQPCESKFLVSYTHSESIACALNISHTLCALASSGAVGEASLSVIRSRLWPGHQCGSGPARLGGGARVNYRPASDLPADERWRRRPADSISHTPLWRVSLSLLRCRLGWRPGHSRTLNLLPAHSCIENTDH